MSDEPINAMITVFRYVIEIEPSPDSAPRVARKYGRKALYKGKANPINPQSRMVKLVEKASFLVAKSPLTCDRLNFSRLRLTAAVAVTSVSSLPNISSMLSKCSTRKVDVFPLYFATAWTVSTAAAFFPRPIKNLGLS